MIDKNVKLNKYMICTRSKMISTSLNGKMKV